MARHSVCPWVVALILVPCPMLRADDGLPPAATSKVDFEAQIKPILQTRCLSCHSRGKYKGGLSLETREALLEGGEEGPAAIVGQSAESNLVRLAAGLEEGRRMPQKGAPLRAEELGLLRAWIDQGLPWPKDLSFGFRQAKLAPRNPEVPAAPAGLELEDPVDRFIARSSERLGWTPVDDRVFVRRVTLDLTGLLPTPERLSAFERDTRPDKRARLVDELLNDRRNYAEHWMTFWNDALRNAYRGTGFIDGGRKTITEWLYRSLYENTSYDRFVRELVSPVRGSEGFTKGIVWRGVVNASQVPPVQAAQNVSQVFLGTNLKCASCHDSFVNHWKLADAYRLASVFAEKPLEIHRCDKPTGQTSAVGFIYPTLGSIDPNAPREERMKRLADLLVAPENGRFARTIVNRLWAALLGRGLVEPLDDMDQAPWDQDLLDWLAADFVAHGHDLKHTLARICTSRAYQLPSVGLAVPGSAGTYVFRGPQTKRMSAEQFADALSALTGVWPSQSDDMSKVDGRGQGGQVAAVRAVIAATASAEHPKPPIQAEWIWSHAGAARDPGGRILLRKSFQVDALPDRAVVVAACDNELVLYLNGKRVAASADWTRPASADVTKLLKVGENVLAAEATNWPDPLHRKGTQIKGANPAGFIAWIGGFRKDEPLWGVGTDETWLWLDGEPKGWPTLGPDTTGWRHTARLPDAAHTYASVSLSRAVEKQPLAVEVEPLRAVLAFDDSLLSALGRTSREQVVTRRESVATTLQALELINGSTLDAKLQAGGRRWFEAAGKQPETLAPRLFLAALGRPPTDAERAAAAELIGTPASVEGVQDLLWSLAMLPEFQLIR